MVRRVEFEYRGVEIQRQTRGPFESGETYTFSLYFVLGGLGVLVSSRVADAGSAWTQDSFTRIALFTFKKIANYKLR